MAHPFNTDGAMLEDRRKHIRVDVNEPAYIFGDGSSTRCILLNLSADGAAIEVPDASIIPIAFRLMTERDRTVRSCRVIWVQRNRLGVAFAEHQDKHNRSRPVSV